MLAAVFSSLLLSTDDLSRNELAGICFGVFGTTLIANPTSQTLVTADIRGVGLVFLAAEAFALGAVLTKRYRTSIPVQSMQAWMMLIGTVILHATSAGLHEESLGTVVWSPVALAALGYLSVVATGVGYLIYFTLLDRIGPVQINLIGYVAPVFAAVNGWILLHEQITVSVLFGFLAIIVGFSLVKYDEIREEIQTL